LKNQFKSGLVTQRMLAVIWEGKNGKDYRKPTDAETAVVTGIPGDIQPPTDPMAVEYTQALPCCTWGLSRWGDMFSPRQLLLMQTLVQELSDLKKEIPGNGRYREALVTSLGIFVDRIAVANTTFGVWHTGGEKLERAMRNQTIPMGFDYPESNPFCGLSGSALNQLEWISRYYESENNYPFSTIL